MGMLVIGTSPIARNHIEALKNTGANVAGLCGYKNLETLTKLAADFQISGTFTSWKDSIDELKPESIVICTPPQISFEILKHISGRGIPCLVEKPALIDRVQLEQLSSLHLDQTFMAFNRRFYNTVQELKSRIQVESKGHLSVEIHEPNFERINEKSQIVLENSIHILDLVLFLTGGQSVVFESIRKISVGVQVLLAIGEIDVTLSISFGVPGNSTIIYDSFSSRYVLRPIEKLMKFSGFDIEEPTQNSPIRKYNPAWTGIGEGELFENGYSFKPGFVKQSQAFYDELLGLNTVKTLCSIKEAYHSLDFAFQIAEFLES